MKKSETTTAPAPAPATEGNRRGMSTAALSGVPHASFSTTVDMTRLEHLLENEKAACRKESWNKIDRGHKIEKLQTFAESYGRENGLADEDIVALKSFFIDCVSKNKLLKTKDVVYNKTTGCIQSIPGLHIYTRTGTPTPHHTFSLRNLDKARVSTLKSLTPRKRSLDATAVSTTDATAAEI